MLAIGASIAILISKALSKEHLKIGKIVEDSLYSPTSLYNQVNIGLSQIRKKEGRSANGRYFSSNKFAV